MAALSGKALQDEVVRTKQVIADRTARGEDLSKQLAHYKSLTGANYIASAEKYSNKPTTPTVTNTPTVVNTPSVTQAPTFDMNKSIQDMMNQSKSYLDNLYNQQRESQLAALRGQRDKAIGQINQQKSQVAPQYQGMRNQTDVVNQQNVQKLREMMAANGLTATGENVSANVSMNNERVNSLNKLNLQEQQTMDDFNRRITDLNNPAEEQALISAIEAERSRSLYDAYNRANDVGYSRYRDSIGDARYNDETTYNRGRDAVGDQRYNQEWNYNVGRDQIADQRYNQEWGYNVGRDKVADQQWNKTFERGVFESDRDFNEDLRRFGLNYALEKQRERRIASSGGSGGSSGGNYPVSDNTPKSKDQSYNDWLGYFANNSEAIANVGVSQFEKQLRDNKTMLKQIQDQGYNIDAVMDSLYAGATGGRFRTKKEYEEYLKQQATVGHQSGGRVVQ